MFYQKFTASFFLLLTITACANTPTDSNNYVSQTRPYLPIEINVLSDTKGALPEYPVNSDAGHYRAYLQASNNDRYRIRVSNNTGQRVGVVVAVDGRNIISGQKSFLQNNERMYILNPHSSDEYEGWRTGSNKVNRFYFTEAENSYAAAWGDNSAMGVIAVAAYAEIPQPVTVTPMTESMRDRASAAEAKSAAKSAAPGTGYGESRYSPSVMVNFQPQPDALEKVFLKYEWREDLCRRKIQSACQNPTQPEQNRFWPDDNKGFAPPPRRRY